MNKQCSRCKETKPLSEFGKRGTHSPGKSTKPGKIGSYQCYCKPCRKQMDYERNIQRYGITLDEFNELLAAQDMKCAICRKEVEGDTRLHIDHDHTTGAVRGLLCSPCNLFIGMADEDPDILRRAAEYLDSK